MSWRANQFRRHAKIVASEWREEWFRQPVVPAPVSCTGLSDVINLLVLQVLHYEMLVTLRRINRRVEVLASIRTEPYAPSWHQVNKRQYDK